MMLLKRPGRYDSLFQMFGEAHGLDQIVGADVVVVQRPLKRERYQLVQALQGAGVAVVVVIGVVRSSTLQPAPAAARARATTRGRGFMGPRRGSG